MNATVETLAARVAERLKTLGVSERAASIRATGQPDTLRFIRTRGVMPSWPKIIQIAQALETSTAYLLGESDYPGSLEIRAMAHQIVVYKELNESLAEQTEAITARTKRLNEQSAWNEVELERLKAAAAAGQEVVPNIPPWEADNEASLPRYASTPRPERVFFGNGDRILAPVTGLNLREADGLVHSPPSLRDKEGAYAFYAQDASMSGGWTGEGQRLVVCDPSWPAVPGDEVVVHLRPTDPSATVRDVLFRRLSEVGPGHMWLTQYEPPASFRVPREDVLAVHRVSSLAEILNV